MTHISQSIGIAISQIIVEIMRLDTEFEVFMNEYKTYVAIYALQNMREQGFQYTVFGKKKMFTWCTYEHRNSDSIIVNGKEGLHNGSGELPYKSDDKFEYLSSFGPGEYQKAADFLMTQITNFVEEDAKAAEAVEAKN